MAPLPPEAVTKPCSPRPRVRGRGERRGLFASLLLLCITAWLTGCVTTEQFFTGRDPKKGPVPVYLGSRWEKEVIFTPDPTQGGKPTPGLAGRVYLFDNHISTPLVGEGCLVIDLYNDMTPNADAPPIEEWRLDKDTLQRLVRRDFVGEGYTLFLPWATYRPDITRVHLKICYQPVSGTPLYAITGPLTLGNDPNPVLQTSPIAQASLKAAARK